MKIVGRNTNNLRYTDGIILLADNNNDLKWLLRKVKEENAKAGLHLSIKETKAVTTEEPHNFDIDNEDIKLLKSLLILIQSLIQKETTTKK